MQSENINNNLEPVKANSMSLAKSALGWLNRVISGTAQEINDFSSILASQVPPAPKPVEVKAADVSVDEIEINLFPESLPQNIVQTKQQQAGAERAELVSNSAQKQLVESELNKSDLKFSDRNVSNEQQADVADEKPLECDLSENREPEESSQIAINESSNLACQQLLAAQIQPINSSDSAIRHDTAVNVEEEAETPSIPLGTEQKGPLPAQETISESAENEHLMKEISGTSSKKLQTIVETPGSSVVTTASEPEILEKVVLVAANNVTAEDGKPVLTESSSQPLKASTTQTGSITISQSLMNTWSAPDQAAMEKSFDPRSLGGVQFGSKNSSKTGNDLNTMTGLQAKGGASAALTAADRAMNFSLTLNNLESGLKSEASKAVKAMTRGQSAATLERVEAALQKASESKDGTQISLRLDPPSLGSVKVDVSFKEGSLHARISAESVQVLQLLRDKAPELQVVLRKLGLDAEKVSVSVNSGDSSLFQDGSDGKQGRSQGKSGSNFSDSANSAAKPDLLNLDHWIA